MDRFDDQLLLALIEDELDAGEAEELRARLAARPDLLAEIEAMCADRRALQSDPEPDVPGDLLTRIENRLARPMLLDAAESGAGRRGGTKPGAYRRRHQRRHGWRIVYRASMAAGFLLILTGGAWLAAVATGRLEPGTLLTFNTEPGPSAQPHDHHAESEAAAGSGSTEWPPAEGMVHHYAPRELGRALPGAASSTATTDAVATGDEAPTNKPAVAADFVLVVRTNDVAAAEQQVQHALTEVGSRIALVQNFSYDKARQLEAEWLTVNAPRAGPGAAGERVQPASLGDNAAPAVAAPAAVSPPTQDVASERRTRSVGDERQSSTQDELSVLADRAQSQIVARESGRLQPLASAALSQQLIGPRDLAASFEQQLAFSSQGATHTITIPAEQLQTLLDRLHAMQGLRTELQLLPTADDVAPIDRQVRDHVRREVTFFAEHPSDEPGAGGPDQKIAQPVRSEPARESLNEIPAQPQQRDTLLDLWIMNNFAVRQRVLSLQRTPGGQTVYLPVVIQREPPARAETAPPPPEPATSSP